MASQYLSIAFAFHFGVGPQLNHCAADVPRLSHRPSEDSERPMGSRRSAYRRATERLERVAVSRQRSISTTSMTSRFG
jgi:hypothetical protein